jgi:hypothetical protein
MSESQTATVYDYTIRQAEVIRLHDRYRRCLMDQKYYARRLSLYQRWDVGSNLFAGVAMLVALATLHVSDLVANIAYGLGFAAALIFIGKPIFRVAEQIERYTILQCNFAEAFCRIEALVADIRRSGKITDEHRIRADELIARCDSVAAREDMSVNRKVLARIQEEVNRAIPAETLWLPAE